MRPVDLHTHSTKSDGTYAPCELIRYAQRKGLKAVALTDHDTAEGIGEAVRTALELGESAPEVIPGVELSTDYLGKDIHIIGLYIDWENSLFNKKLREFSDARIYRNQKMCRLLTEGGYEITFEALQESFPDTVITRAHFAQYLLNRKMISSIDEAFDKLIGDNCPYFVPREKISPHDAVDFLLQFGAVPVLAHPVLYHMSDEKPADTAYLSRIADSFGLLYSGGSDFHGSRKKNLDLGTGYGHLFIPETILPPIREMAARRRQEMRL